MFIDIDFVVFSFNVKHIACIDETNERDRIPENT